MNHSVTAISHQHVAQITVEFLGRSNLLNRNRNRNRNLFLERDGLIQKK